MTEAVRQVGRWHAKMDDISKATDGEVMEAQILCNEMGKKMSVDDFVVEHHLNGDVTIWSSKEAKDKVKK